MTGVAAQRRESSGRAGWHRRAGLVPMGYLAAVVGLAFAHPFVAQAHWLLIHLLLLGAVTNAIVIWSAHFAAAILRIAVPASRRGEVARLAVLNAGVLGVLSGGAFGPPWVAIAGAVGVFAAITAHLVLLARWLRRALPARYSVTVRYYLAAGMCLLAGIPVGAWMLLVDDARRPRLLLFHAHVNLLGFVTLTVVGTLLTLWPTVLRTRMVETAPRAVRRALPLCIAGLLFLAVGCLAWWPLLATGGLVVFGTAIALTAWPIVVTARERPPASFAAWSIAAGLGWLLIALAWDAVALVTAPDAASAADRFDAILAPLGGGFVVQVLLGALAYLLPMALGGGPGNVRQRTARLDAYWAQRVTMTNLALAVYLLPATPYVRITTALVLLAALLQFLIPAARILSSRPRPSDATVPPSTLDAPPLVPPAARPLGSVAAGIALVLLAVIVGVVGQHATDAGTGVPQSAAAVPPTGHTTTIAVTATGMRYQPDELRVPAGDRLVIVLTNAGGRRHDLVLATGTRTPLLAPGDTARLDAGVIGGKVAGWCSQPAHRAGGMTLTITTTNPPMAPMAGTDSAPAARVDAMADPGPGFTARDATLPPAPRERTHRITLHAQEVRRDISPGVSQTLWTFNGTTPGPALRGRVGDTFEITLINEGSVEHGIDFHAEALAPDTAMRTVEPGQQVVYRFTATKAGIWMYHCSAMPMLYHVGNGMYGALVIDPPDLSPVDHEYLLVQSEFYLGAQGQAGDAAKMATDQPDAIAFNGYVSQYAFRPLTAYVGQRVRIWVLNAGPNRACAYHLVGAPFDTVYTEGSYRVRPADPGGAQILDLAPAAGGFVETVLTQPGIYPFLSHALADADRGARGSIQVTR